MWLNSVGIAPRIARLGLVAACLSLTLSLASCANDVELPQTPGSTPSAGATTPAADPQKSAAPGQPGAPGAPGGPGAPDPSTSPAGEPAPTSANQPVPKVQRSEASSKPTATAKPTSIDGTVRYSDGVSLKVTSVEFAKETKKGPGNFPGRAYAVLGLQVSNKSSAKLSMSTVVVTVLDKDGAAVAPVYTEEAKVQDFSGTLKKGKTVKAKYAFAVPKSSRSNVTVVVDFDGVHTSAVFRGKLS